MSKLIFVPHKGAGKKENNTGHEISKLLIVEYPFFLKSDFYLLISQYRTGPVRSGQSGQVRRGQVRTSQVRTSQGRDCRIGRLIKLIL